MGAEDGQADGSIEELARDHQMVAMISSQITGMVLGNWMSDPAWVGALARYLEAMAKEGQARLLPMTDDVRARASQGIGGLLFGADSSDPIPPKVLRRDEVVFLKLFYGMVEITAAFDMLQDAEVYIRRFPHRGLIPPDRFMRYHITNFYNNAYVLKLRLDTYTKNVGRSYRKATHVTKIEDLVIRLNKIVSATMKPITHARGSYIHQNHFADHHFERLNVTALLATREEGQTGDQFVQSMAQLHRVSFKRARKEWVDRVASNNKELSKLLDVYFHLIHRIVFDKNGHIFYPHSLPARSD
jgi:hypothetical protein